MEARIFTVSPQKVGVLNPLRTVCDTPTHTHTKTHAAAHPRDRYHVTILRQAFND